MNTQKNGRTREAKNRKALDLRKRYLIERKKGFPAKHAIRNARIRQEWYRLEACDIGEPTIGQVRLQIVADEYASTEDLFGDIFNPKVNTDISEERLKRQEEQEIERVNQDGVWTVSGEYFDGEQWQHVDSCSGFIGDDWKDSGYDIDIMSVTLSAAKEVSICECCGRPKHKVKTA